MSSIFNPTGHLNVSWDASDLPGEANQNTEVSGAMTRCKNLRVDQNGLLKVRDGSYKLNSTAINTEIWWIEEMSTVGKRYTFAGDSIYENEVSIASGLTSAQWSAFHYNSYNDTTKQIFAINGSNRKRITSGAVNEWGIAAPATAPTLTSGSGKGLTGSYKAVYTYVRKVGSVVVCESNPSPAPDAIVLDDQSLAIEITQPTDTQVTHIRSYRTLTNGLIYYFDNEIAVSTTYTHGYVFDWESTGAYIAGTGYKFTITDSTNGTENTYTWEETFLTADDEEDETPSDNPRYTWPPNDYDEPEYWDDRARLPSR